MDTKVNTIENVAASDKLHPITGQRWLSAALVGLYFLNLWTPPHIWVQNLTWYLVLGYGLVVYIVQGEAFSYPASRVFWGVAGLMALGAGLSLFRGANPDRVLWNTTGMVVHFISLFLFLPALSAPLTRRILLLALILAGHLWMFAIQRQLVVSGEITSHIFFRGKGNDKNVIALCLALAATSMMALTVLWVRPERLPAWVYTLGRLIMALIAGYFAYSLLPTYSRSGLLVLVVGYWMVIGLIWRRYGLLRTLQVVVITGLLIGFLANRVLHHAPGWAGYLEVSQFQTRISLIQKTLSVIRDNPLIGIGPDETREVYPFYRETQLVGLPHNAFLKGWAEFGILGLAGYGVWIVAYIRLLGRRFSVATLVDRIWLVVMIPYFFMMMFLDLGGNSWFMLALLAGMYDEQKVD